jgi:hypothetical protein
MKKELTFLSRHYPPNPNINGESIWDMAKYIKDNYGIESNIICIDRDAPGGGEDRIPVGKVTRIKTFYQGNNAILRFMAFLYDGFILAYKARQYKDTTIVATTSPPLLPFWCSLLLPKKTVWGVWTLDLFPEAFTQMNNISSKNLIYRWVKRKNYQRPPNFLITLGPQQALYLQNEYQQDIPNIILPCGILFHQEKSTEIPDWWTEDKIFLGYCGNIGEAHNPELIRAAIDAINPDKHRLILALYGTKSEKLKAYAQNKPGVILVKRVPRNQLHYIQIHLATLTKGWTHIAVPSKAVSAIAMNSCLLFCGDKRSDNWYMFQKAGWFIDENDKISEQVQAFIDQLTLEDIKHKSSFTDQLYEELKAYVLSAYQQMAENPCDADATLPLK